MEGTVNLIITSRLRYVARAIGVVVGGVGALALLGRISGMDVLAFLIPGTRAAMKANTAFSLVLACAAVQLLAPPGVRGLRLYLGRGCATLMATIGALTLCEHLFNVDLRIDQLLARETPGELATVSPGRMGPPASLCFTLLGTALFFIDARVGRRGSPAQRLAMISSVVALVPLIGYTYGVEAFYFVPRLTGIALESAICLTALNLAVLFLRADRGAMSVVCAQNTGGALARILLPPTLILPIVFGLIRLIGERRGYYRTAEGTALLVMTLIIVFTAIVFWAARTSARLATARDRAERAEADVNRQIITILDGISQGFFAIDRDWRITYVNRRGEEFVGLSRGQLIGQRIADDFPTIIDESAYRDFRQAMTRDVPIQGEYFSARHNRWYENYIVPTENGISIFLQDITERRRRDDERRELLEAERAARTEAQHANRMKDEFLATLSHELRTPLNAILGWAQLLTRDKRSPNEMDLHDGLTAIHRNARHQAQLIEDLLDMSRIISGKLRLNIQRVNIVEVIRSALESVRPAADAKQISVVADFEGDAIELHGDTGRLQQIAWNLLSNAMKFTPRGGRVTTTVRQCDAGVEIVVRDTGIGMKPEFVPYVFERFKQADASTTRKFGGLGIGLSIVRHLTELHGGTVHADSEGTDRGATFTVRLPVASAPADAATADAAPPAVLARDDADGQMPSLSGVKVMVVDDEADTRALLRRLLERVDADVTTASSTAEAIGLFATHPPHVLIADIGMPDADGYELMRRVRAMTNGATTPAIALTAFARPEDRRRALISGFQMHIAKPVDPVELSLIVASLAGRAKLIAR